MDNQITTEKLSPRKWWWLKLTDFNKGLFISGFISVIIYCAIVLSLVGWQNIAVIAIYVYSISYCAYMVLANLLFAFGWLVDIALNNYYDEKLSGQIFIIVYWVAVTMPLLLMSYLIYLSIQSPDILI
jgi:hypothetical protein